MQTHERAQAGLPRGAGVAVLEAVLEQLPRGVVVVEAATGGVTHANGYAREVLGGSIASARLDAPELELFDRHGRRLEPEERPIARALRHGEAVHDEQLGVVRADGVRRSLFVSTRPIAGPDGKAVAAVVVFEDSSGRIEHQRAERDFITNAAHELRTPLAAIASAVEVLQGGAKEVPQERDRFIGHIEREGARLARLSRTLLLLARVQTLSERPRFGVVQLRPLLHDVASATRVAEAVRLSVSCRRDLGALTNRDLVEQALLNLAGNAARYTEKGTVTLAARRSGGRVVIEVRDTGTGLSPEALERAFDRFFRGDSGGSGLGLSIARQAIEAVGGTIALESAEGRGTVGRIVLPPAQLAR